MEEEILIFDDDVSFYENAAKLVAEIISHSIQKNQKAAIALSGGNTPNGLFDLLSHKNFSEQINWKKVDLFWSDERMVEHTSKDSNYFNAKNHLIDKIEISSNLIHPIPYSENANDSAEKYQTEIEKYFGEKSPVFDLILLGMGDDGHTASLFPGTRALNEKEKLIVAVDPTPTPFQRVSFSFPLINSAKNVMILAKGESKAKPLQQLFEKNNAETPLPISNVHPNNGKLIWILDNQAVSLLNMDR